MGWLCATRYSLLYDDPNCCQTEALPCVSRLAMWGEKQDGAPDQRMWSQIRHWAKGAATRHRRPLVHRLCHVRCSVGGCSQTLVADASCCRPTMTKKMIPRLAMSSLGILVGFTQPHVPQGAYTSFKFGMWLLGWLAGRLE